MKLTFAFVVLILIACEKKEATPSPNISFEGSQRVTITGYTDHVMEPFLSRDGNTLMFNNSNEAVNTNLHWATRVNDSTFEYKGEITGVNTASLEGVPTMDMNGNFYFVSTRDYDQILATLYQGIFDKGTVTNLTLVENISKYQAGWVNFDVEVDSSGETLYFVDGRFDQSGGPYESDIVIAQKENGEFQRLSNSDELLADVNTEALEYAACISADNLELYFTRVAVPLTVSSKPEILVATRENVNDPFRAPIRIESINGFVEAATISPGGKILYYHKKESDGKFSLYLTRRLK
ncbi:MAG: hypothetical protein L0Y35_03780 [Flammeovirgaceae bacterium]|nr:hypothetical protein [Flammeovirgaceae bacterium]